jgi:hypothetical protein
MVMNLLRGQLSEAENLNAKRYDVKRHQLQNDIKKLFKVVQHENKQIS